MSKVELNEGRIIFRSNVAKVGTNNVIKSIDDIAIADKKAYNILHGDGEVFEFINKVELGEEFPAIPDPWTTIILTKEWAQSFVSAVDKVAKPVFIGGHADYAISTKERAIPDGYIVGGKVIDNTLYLRNMLPEGGSDERKALIKQTVKEIKAGMLSTSTSDYMRYSINVDDDSGDVIYYAQESVKGQSNALVEEDQTGSTAEIIITSFKADTGSDGEQKGAKQMGEKTTNVELFTSLKNQLDSGRLALSEVASNLGIELMTSKQKAALKRLNDAESTVGNITDFVESVKAEKTAAFAALKEVKLKDKFKTDELIEVATPLFNLKEGDAAAIDAEIERIASLKVFKTLQGTLAASINAQLTGQSEVTLITESEGIMEG